MKHLMTVILSILVLVATVTGCGGAHRYNSRLVLADSLMRPDPDSALAIVQSVDRDSLTGEGDRAYRDLLLTQARYRCYEAATSDSDINRALAYYRTHSGEREKLTRSLIYKGTVMDELGHPDSAMLCYKQAEATAAPDDYFNLGYAKLQMGALYNSYYSMDGKECLKYEEALDCFRLANDSVYMLVCLNNLGCLYRGTKPDKAELLLKEALSFAKQLCDTTRIIYSSWALVELDYNQRRLEDARRLIREATDYGIEDFDYSFFFTASNVYSGLGIHDTAEIYIDLAAKNHNVDDALYQMHRLGSLSELALSKNDTLSYLRYGRESERIADSLKSNNKKLDILNAEIIFDKETKETHQNHYHKVISSYQWLIVLGGAILAFLMFGYYRRWHRYDRLISELKKENKSQLIDLQTLQQNINKLKINDLELKEFIYSHIDMMRKVIEECYHSPQGHLSKEIRQIVKYQDEKSGIWSRLYHYLDLQYNNIMSDTMKRFPQLGEKELLMIALTCMGYSCSQIAIVLDYSNSAGISTIRKRIAKKMGLECLLSEYIEQYKSNH